MVDGAKFVGAEDDPGEGFEYVLAFVNKKTMEVEFKPTSLIKFEAKYKPDPDAINGIRFTNANL